MEDSKMYSQSIMANETLITSIVSQLEDSIDKTAFESYLSHFDQKFYQYYASQNYQVYSPVPSQYQEVQSKSVQLGLPKSNSLTDSMLRNTMGCEQKLAKSYLQIINKNEIKEDEQKKNRNEVIKIFFATSNFHRDSCANSKPYMNPFKFKQQRPVIDNQHQAYLKTQLIYLEQPKGASISAKDYFDKHTDSIAKKIIQLGGIQDTISQMEESLSKNEVKSFKQKQILNMNQEKRNLFAPHQDKFQKRTPNGWLNKSRQMRESFITKFQIQ